MIKHLYFITNCDSALVLGRELSFPTLGKLFKLSEFHSFIKCLLCAWYVIVTSKDTEQNQTKILALVELTSSGIDGQ